MGFRDDRDALRARAEAAERQLAERDRRFEAMERRLDEVEAELGRLSDARAPSSSSSSRSPAGSEVRLPPWLVRFGPVLAAALVAGAISWIAVSLGERRADAPSPPPAASAPASAAAPPPAPASPRALSADP